MSLPRYPKYKDSGIGWLGEVPAHWDVVPNKSFMSRRQALVGHQWRDTQLLSLTLRGVIHRDIDSGHGKYPADFGTYQEVAPGDLVFCLFDMDETPRTVGLSDTHGMITGAYEVFRCEPHALPSYVTYYYLHVDSFKGLRPFYTGLRKVVRPPTFMAINIPLPDLPEQAAIAAFLDRETAKIDALVAEQERLIELLKEKRQAVISHAVTKGLNPDVPMKDSGIEWLGEVPAHWQAKRLKQVSMKLTDGEHISPSLSTEGVALLSAKDVRDRTIDYDVDKFVSAIDAIAFWRRCKPERGDVLVVSRGATVGRVGLVTEDIDFCLMGSVILCKPTNGYSSEFLYYVLNAKHSQMSLWFSSASSAQQAIYIRDVAEVPFAVPPIEEREAIVAFLDSETSKIETLTAEAQRAIELLQERRTALISAAVTGQIDVREAAGRAA